MLAIIPFLLVLESANMARQVLAHEYLLSRDASVEAVVQLPLLHVRLEWVSALVPATEI